MQPQLRLHWTLEKPNEGTWRNPEAAQKHFSISSGEINPNRQFPFPEKIGINCSEFGPFFSVVWRHALKGAQKADLSAARERH
jgi:hypothetical protein